MPWKETAVPHSHEQIQNRLLEKAGSLSCSRFSSSSATIASLRR